jgi:hypothetical protein
MMKSYTPKQTKMMPETNVRCSYAKRSRQVTIPQLMIIATEVARQYNDRTEADNAFYTRVCDEGGGGYFYRPTEIIRAAACFGAAWEHYHGTAEEMPPAEHEEQAD